MCVYRTKDLSGCVLFKTKKCKIDFPQVYMHTIAHITLTNLTKVVSEKTKTRVFFSFQEYSQLIQRARYLIFSSLSCS